MQPEHLAITGHHDIAEQVTAERPQQVAVPVLAVLVPLQRELLRRPHGVGGREAAAVCEAGRGWGRY